MEVATGRITLGVGKGLMISAENYGPSGSHITQKASPLGGLFLWESCQVYGAHVTVLAEPQGLSPCSSRPASVGSNMASCEKPLVSRDLEQGDRGTWC